MNQAKPELIAPAGTPASLSAALKAGADAVYFGIGKGNMRANVRNFSHPEFTAGVKKLHAAGRRAYLTLNTIFFDHELGEIERKLDFAGAAAGYRDGVPLSETGVDAVIAWDPAVISACSERGIPVHVSTQASVANIQALRFYESLGATAVVLARELTLEQIRAIRPKTSLKIECFVHGAMCVAVSGRCFMSHYSRGRSANRGDCLQPCRYPYQIHHADHKQEFELFEHAVMSPKDMCTIPILDKLIAAGIDMFKIEGRARGADYVATVCRVYRTWIDALTTGAADAKLQQRLLAELSQVFHRGFSTGFFMGRPLDAWSGEDNYASRRKMYVGKVVRVYQRVKVVEIKLEARSLNRGAELLILGPDCGAVQFRAESMQIEHAAVETAAQGSHVGIRLAELQGIRRNDKVFVLLDSPVNIQ